jgi:predicted aspartyl protease
MHERRCRNRGYAWAALRRLNVFSVAIVLVHGTGCGGSVEAPSAPLFSVPLAVQGESVGTALVDTGGGYEVMLRRSFGLDIVDSLEVVVFGGTETVAVTEGFAYTAGGIDAVADAAIVGASICDCNGVGFPFFRKTGVVLGLDFAEPAVAFLPLLPVQGVTIDFVLLPEDLSAFDTSFIEVEVVVNGGSQTLLALLDTGANTTVIRRELVDSAEETAAVRPRVTVTHGQLGSVSIPVLLSNNDSLPAMILGTDAMGKWADRWYFSFTPDGGSVTVVRGGNTSPHEPTPPPL